MSNAQTTHSGRARGLPGSIVLCGGASTDENRDEQRHDDDHGAVMSSTDSSTGMPSSAPFVEQLNPETEDATGSPTVNHHSALEDMDASNAFLRTLAGMDDDEVLASILRLRFRADVHRDVARVGLDSQDVETGVLELQPVMAPDDAETPPGPQRTHEGGNENEALLDKRRRMRSEERPESPPASCLRLRAPFGAITNASSSTAATRTTLQIHTAAAAAPSRKNKGAVVVESNERVANGVDAMPIASLALSPPARQPCDRAEPSPDVRRSKRVAILAAIARKRAAAAVRAAVKAVPVARLRRQSVIMRGNGGGEGRA